MCGRYLVEADEMEMREIIALAEKDACFSSAAAFTDGEVFPGNAAPVITAGRGARFMVWGYPALNAGRRPHINARSETAAALKTFGGAMAARRCVVPASGYFEWKALGKKSKEKYLFTLPGRALMHMAGIYSDDGRYAILTREAGPAFCGIHDRMPAIIPKALVAVWLAGTPGVLGEAVTALRFERVPEDAGLPEQLSLFQ